MILHLLVIASRTASSDIALSIPAAVLQLLHESSEGLGQTPSQVCSASSVFETERLHRRERPTAWPTDYPDSRYRKNDDSPASLH